ncbi:DUF4097 family beta strand repeat-containing protein [Lysobacter humi (ex Lee et al. 2017)]
MRPVLLLLPLALAIAPALAAENIDKVNGSIRAESGRTYGSLETVNGSIRIETNARAGEAETVNGSISVENGAQVGPLSTVNGSIRIERDVRVGGAVETVNGSVFIDRGGVVGGNVETVNGAIGLVATQLSGGIETVNGDVTVGIDSHVRGAIRIFKPKKQFISVKRRDPRVIIGPNARVDGPLVFERPVELWVHQSARIGTVTGATAQRFTTATPPVSRGD